MDNLCRRLPRLRIALAAVLANRGRKPEAKTVIAAQAGKTQAGKTQE